MKKEGKGSKLGKRNPIIIVGAVILAVLGVLAFNFWQGFDLSFFNSASEFSAENYTSEDFKNGIIKEFSTSDGEFEFSVGKEDHFIGVKEISDASATIVVQSEPLELTLSISEETKIELTGDNYYDLYIKLESIEDEKANFIIKSIKEEISIIPEELENQDSGSSADNSNSGSGAASNQNTGAQNNACTNTCSLGYNQNPYPDCNCYAVDTDGDGVKDPVDDFPVNPLEWKDTDGDGVGDNSDAFPNNAAESKDTDGDGVGNNADTDDDNDGSSDNADAFPLNSNEWLDTDSDGIGNNADTDDDGDNYNDAADIFPLDSSEWLDTDSDGIGNNADTDDDNDGVLDEVDINPLDASITGKIGGQNQLDDFDNDGAVNKDDSDDDNDGINDASDLAPFDASDTRHWICITCGMNWDTAAYGMGPWFNEYYIGSFNTLSKGYHVHEMKAEVKVSNQYPGTSIRYKWDINGNLIWDGTINLADGWKNCGTASNLNPNIDYRYQDGRYNLGQPTAGMLIKVSAIVD